MKLCACVDFLDGMVKVNDTMCSLRCFTNENIACGGQNGNTNFYKIYGRYMKSISCTFPHPKQNYTMCNESNLRYL